MRRKRSFAIAFGLFGSLLAAGWIAVAWAKRSPWLSERLRGPIQAALAKASGRAVRLGGVGGGLNGWIWLQDVGLGPDPAGRSLDLSLTAKAIGLRFSLLDLARGKADLSGLRGLRVEEPSLFLLRRTRPEDASPSARSAAATDWRRALQGLPLPPVRLDLRDGEAWQQDDGGPLRRLALGLRLGLEPATGGWRLRGQADLESGGRVALWGRSHADLSAVELKARASGLKLAPWSARLDLPEGLSLTAGVLSGELGLAEAPGGAWSYSGQGDLDDGGLRWRGQEALAGASAHWIWDGHTLALSRVGGRSGGGHWDGQLQWGSATGVKGHLHLRKAELAGLLGAAGAPQSLSLSGRADLDLQSLPGVSGTAWSLDLGARGAAWAGRPLQRLQLRGNLQGLSLSASVDLAWEGGQGQATLDLDADGLRQAGLQAEGLPAAWAQPWVGAALQGRVDATGRWRRLAGQQPWELRLRSARVDLDGLAAQDVELNASGAQRQAQARLAMDLGDWKGLNAAFEAAAAGEAAWDIKRLRLYEGEQLRADAAGRWQSGRLDLSLRSAELPVPVLRRWLPASLAALSGTVKAQGGLQWQGHGASGQLKVDAPLQAAGQDLALNARLTFSPQGVSLSALDLRRGELKGWAEAPAWKGPWSAELALQGAPWTPWLALLGAPALLSGTASGSLSLGKGGLFSADLKLEEPWPQALPNAKAGLKFTAEGGRWQLQRLELRQGDGRLEAAASVDLEHPQAWQGSAHWQGLRLHGATLQGEAALGAGERGNARLNVGPWSLSGTALPSLRADLSLRERALRAVWARLGEACNLTLERPDGHWLARAELKGQDPAALLGAWTGRPGPSGLALSGWAELRQPAEGPATWALDLADTAAPESRLQAQGSLRGERLKRAQWVHWDLGRSAKALAKMGLASLPVSAGRLEGEALSEAGGLSLSAKAEGLKALGVDLGPAELQAWLGPRHWSLERLRAGGSGPRVSLEHWQGQSEAGAWSAAGDLSLDQWPAAIFSLGGEGHLQLSGKGSQGQAESQWKQLSVSERSYAKLGLRASWDRGRLSLAEASKPSALKAELRFKDGAVELSDLQALAGKGRAWLKGSVGSKGELHFEGGAQGFPAGELTACLGWTQDWRGAAYGSLSLDGTTERTRGVISVKIEDGSVEGLPFDLATALVHLEPGWVELSPLRPIRLGRRNGVALEVTGKVPLAGDDGAVPGGLEVDAELKDGGLGLLAGLPMVEAASGPLELSLRFSGRRDDPQVRGRLRVSKGSLTPAWLLPPLQNVELFAQIEDGQLLLHKAEAQVGPDGPLLKLETSDPKRPALVFERWLPSALNLHLRASKSGLPLRATKDLKFIDGQAHPDLRLGGSWDDPVLEGELRLDRGDSDKAVVQWPPRFAKSAGGTESDFLKHLRYGLRLIARQDVMVRTEAAQVFVDSGEAGILLTGGGDERELEGRLRFTHGSIDYLLASFQLDPDKETRIDFRRGVVPELELYGLKQVRDALLSGATLRRDVDVRLHAFGPLGEVQMQLESDDPSLSQQQLASLAGLGVDTSDPRAQGGFVRMLGKVPARLLTSLLRRTGMVDEVGVRSPAIEDAVAGPQATPGIGEAPEQPAGTSSTGRTLVAIDAGKYLGEKLYVGVSGLLQERPNAQPGGASTVDPAVGGKVEYQLKDRTRLSAEHNIDTQGQTEQRVMLERSSSFENYNPRRRRWDQATPGASPPSPQPSPSPSPTP